MNGCNKRVETCENDGCHEGSASVPRSARSTSNVAESGTSTLVCAQVGECFVTNKIQNDQRIREISINSIAPRAGDGAERAARHRWHRHIAAVAVFVLQSIITQEMNTE
jgi:hypothetical protein